MAGYQAENAEYMPQPLEESKEDILTEGLMNLFKPAVEEIDDRVRAVRESQFELRKQIDSLSEDLKRISEKQQAPVELDSYVKKLINSRRKIVLVTNILQNVQERLTKLQYNLSKETGRRKALLNPPSPGPPTTS